MSSDASQPMMDVTEEQAKPLIGKHILVGLAHMAPDGSVTSREQFHGIVLRATPAEGVVVRLHGTQHERAVRLELANLKIARPGQYQLTGTKEIVEDPDYTLKVFVYA